MINKKKNNSGFTIVELMISLGIFVVLIAGVMTALLTGQDTWTNTNTNIQVQENVRLILEKISKELRETGADSTGAMQITINNGTGVGNSDVIRFSIPITCQSGGSIIDSSGDVAHWGATLNWGCTSSSCMDADDDCATIDYKYIQYSINSANQLLRTVLNNNFVAVKQEIFAQNIVDLQAVLSTDQKIVTLTITVLKNTNRNRQISNTSNLNVYLRNGG